jgi:hypothetical protein
LLEQWKADQGIALNTAQFNLTANSAKDLPIGSLPDLSGADENMKFPVSMHIVGALNGEVSVGLQGSCILSCILFCILTPNYDQLAHRRLSSLTRLPFNYSALLG